MALYPGRNGEDAVARLVSEVLESLRVFNTLDKLDIPEKLLVARARNIATNLIANYDMRPLPGPYTVDFADPKIGPGYPRRYSTQAELMEVTPAAPTKPASHGWSCRCEACDTYNRSVRR